MSIRHKRPDPKNALSILASAKRDMHFTLTLKPGEESGPTIVRNIYECFRMLGDALLVAEGIASEDHIMPIQKLLKVKAVTSRPISIIDNLRRLRHNINYYGYKPKLIEVEDTLSVAKSCFEPLYKEVFKKIK